MSAGDPTEPTGDPLTWATGDTVSLGYLTTLDDDRLALVTHQGVHIIDIPELDPSVLDRLPTVTFTIAEDPDANPT